MHILGRSLRKRGVDQSHDYVTLLYSVFLQCVGSRCGRWTWSLGRALNDVISRQCVCLIKLGNVTSLLCFHSFFKINHHPYIALNFLQKGFCLL